MPRMLTNIILSFDRKGFRISSTEIPPQCQPNFDTSYLEFGSAYTYLVRRKVGNSFHCRRSAQTPLIHKHLGHNDLTRVILGSVF